MGGILTGILSVFTWRRRQTSTLLAISFFLAATTVWILAYLGEILALDLRWMTWFARVEYVGIVSVGPTWLAFALAYTGRWYMVTRGRIMAAAAVSFLVLFLVWTSDWNSLIWQSLNIGNTSAGTVLAPEYGPGFWFNIAYQYSCLALATLILLWSVGRESSPLRDRGFALVIGTMAPWAGNLLYVTGTGFAVGVDLTVYGLAAAGVAFGWGLMARTLVELVPVARDRVIEMSEDPVFVIHATGLIVDANPAALALLGRTGPLGRLNVTEAFAPHGVDPMGLSPGRTLLDFSVGDPPRIRIFDCRISNLGEDAAMSRGRVLTLRDVTEAEEHRRALEEGREFLEAQILQKQKMEVVGTLAGGVAHDFNNILAVIGGYTEIAISDLPADSPVKESLAQVATATDRAADLVRQILTFSRQVPENRRHFRLREVVAEAAGFLRASFPSSIEIRTGRRTERDLVRADWTQIHQAIMNLCSNARDALGGRADGFIEVTIDRLTPPPGRLPENLLGPDSTEWLRIAVRDNGGGMDEGVKSRIFEPFFTTKEVGKGTGLGLAAVHGIVMAHDGWVDVASKRGKGTEMSVWLRPAEGPGPAPTPPLSPEPATGRYLRVLVVDDEASIRGLSSRFLTDRGHEVRLAENARDARRIMEEEPSWAQIVLTDHTMPGKTGLAFLRELRAGGHHIPAIMMTGLGDTMDPDVVEAAGITAVLAKPFTRKELLETLEKATDSPEEGVPREDRPTPTPS